MLSVVIDNKNGTLWDISTTVTGMSWKTSRVGKAATLELKFVTDSLPQGFDVQNGNIIRVKLDSMPIMYGYIFKVEDSDDDTVSLTAYDQVRYLQGTDTYVFENKKATEIIQRIATDLQLTVGSLADTGYAIPTQSEDAQRMLDIITRALQETSRQTGNVYVFYDDFGKLMLKRLQDMAIDLDIGDESLLTSYKRSRSIEDTANYIKVAQDNKKDGNRKIYPVRDLASIAKWGQLTYYHKVDDGLNESQIFQIRDSLAEQLNKESLSFGLEAIGDIRVRAGCSIGVTISEIGINQMAVVDECTHKWDGDQHTMSLTMVGIKN